MITALTLLSLLCLGNLFLTVGVVRRIKQHGTALDVLAGDPPPVMRAAGETVDDVHASTVDGDTITPGRSGGPTLVGFLSPTCGPCREQLPTFLARAARAPAGRTVAVVVGAGAEVDTVADQLGRACVTVVERRGGPVAAAFGVIAYPAFALVGADGRIEASSSDLATIPTLVAASE